MKRPFCVIGVSFLLSALTASILPAQVQLLAGITCILAFAFALVFVNGRNRPVIACALLCAGFAMGLFYGKTALRYDKVTVLDGKTLEITAEVTDIKPRDNHRYTYTVTVHAVEKKPSLKNFKLVIYSDAYLNLDYYDEVTLPVRFFLPDRSETFDSVNYYRADDIYILSHFDGKSAVSVRAPERKPFLYRLKMLNRSAGKTFDRYMAPEEAAVLKSLVLGDRSEVDYTLNQSYIAAGTIHLFAISGIHVSILAGFLALLFRFWKGKRRVPALIQMAVITGFIVLSGMSLSSVRAGIMILIMLSGQLFARRADALNSLCCAGFFIVLTNVYAVMDLGFLMSFAATLGIILCQRPIVQWLTIRLRITGKFAGAVTDLVSVSVSANLFLLPVYVFSYGTFSFVLIPANLMTNLTGTVSIVTGFVLLLFSMIPVPAIVLLPLFAFETWVLRIQNTIVTFWGRLPFASIGLDYDVIQICFLLCVLLITAAFLYRKRQNLMRPAVLLCLVVILTGNIISMLSVHHKTQLAVIGDGNSSNLILIENYNATVISPADNDYIDERTFRYLRAKGIRRIDNLVLLYEDMGLYQDTVRLAENVPTQNILYHRANTACKQLMKEKSKSLLAVGNGTQVKVNKSMTIEFAYHKNKLSVFLNCRGAQIAMTDDIPALQKNPYDIALVTGAVSGELVKIPSEHVLVMQSQRKAVTADMRYLEPWGQTAEFEIRQGGALLFTSE